MAPCFEHGIILLSIYTINGRFHVVYGSSSHNVFGNFHFVLKFDGGVLLVAVLAAYVVVEDVAFKPFCVIEGDVVVNGFHIRIDADVP